MKKLLDSPVILILGIITIAELFVTKKIKVSFDLWALYGLYKFFKD